jgi:hypothetical protein
MRLLLVLLRRGDQFFCLAVLVICLGFLQIFELPLFVGSRRVTSAKAVPVSPIPRQEQADPDHHADDGSAANASASKAAVFNECFRQRFAAYWDAANRSIQSLNPHCRLETWVQHVSPRNITASTRSDFEHTHPDLMKRLEGSCILLLGDSTDRQIIEQWCPRWSKNSRIEVWMPQNKTTGRPIRDDHPRLVQAVWDNAGLRCRPRPNVTIGTYLHYGVSEPPYWKFAHTYNPELVDDVSLDWGSTTNERVQNDVPKFFRECHGERRVVVVQSYLWDLARQWFIYDTEQPPMEMIAAWADNVTHLVQKVRAAVPPGTLVGWRYAGPLMAAKGRDTETILRMNDAIADVSRLGVDFVADYGAILGSNLTKNPFPAHPPQHPLALYLNLLFNAIFAAW